MSSIICLGNFGTGDINQYKVANLLEYLITKFNCKIILGLGNNILNVDSDSDNITEKEFENKFISPYINILDKVKFYNIFGNEDYKFKNIIKAQLEFSKINKKWVLPNNFYCFKKILNKVPIEFIAIDSNFTKLSKDIQNIQEKWFINTVLDSRARWNIIYTHYPYDINNSNTSSNNNLNKFYEIIFNTDKLSNKIDLIICGHLKYQQHIYIPDKPNMIISGVGGDYDKNDLINFNIYKELKYISNNLGCVMLDFSKNNLKIQFFNIDKNKEYNFTIHKI